LELRAEQYRRLNVSPAEFSGEPETKSAEQEKEEEQVGRIFDRAKILVPAAAPRHPTMKVLYIRKEGAKLSGVTANDFSATRIDQQSVAAEGDFSGTVWVGKQGQGGWWTMLIGGCPGKQRGGENTGVREVRCGYPSISLGVCSDLRLESQDAARDCQKSDRETNEQTD
jgi:hypothetical protein